LKECGGIGVAIGLGLNKADNGLLICLFCTQNGKVVGGTGLQLPSRQFKRGSGGGFGVDGGVDSIGILFKCVQRVGNILKRGKNGGAILFRSLNERCLGCTLTMQQSATLKYWLCNISRQSPKPRATSKHLAGLQSHGSGVGGQSRIRQPVRHRDANLGAGGVQIFLGLTHIRSLFHELRRQTQRQFMGQLQT